MWTALHESIDRSYNDKILRDKLLKAMDCEAYTECPDRDLIHRWITSYMLDCIEDLLGSE